MIRSRVTKNGVKFYDGRKLATEKQAREFIKMQSKSGLFYNQIADDKLSKYQASVKGGYKRQQSAIVDRSGKFISKELQDKALKNLGIDIEALKKAKDVKTISELFKDENLKSRLFDVFDSGISAWYSPANAIDKINQHTGELFLNNSEISKPKLVKWVNEIMFNGRRYLDAIDGAFNTVIVNLTQLKIEGPEPYEIEDYEDTGEFNKDWGNSVILYSSDKKKKKKEANKKAAVKLSSSNGKGKKGKK
jgi:hypothetical protein